MILIILKIIGYFVAFYTFKKSVDALAETKFNQDSDAVRFTTDYGIGIIPGFMIALITNFYFLFVIVLVMNAAKKLSTRSSFFLMIGGVFASMVVAWGLNANPIKLVCFTAIISLIPLLVNLERKKESLPIIKFIFFFSISFLLIYFFRVGLKDLGVISYISNFLVDSSFPSIVDGVFAGGIVGSNRSVWGATIALLTLGSIDMKSAMEIIIGSNLSWPVYLIPIFLYLRKRTITLFLTWFGIVLCIYMVYILNLNGSENSVFFYDGDDRIGILAMNNAVATYAGAFLSIPLFLIVQKVYRVITREVKSDVDLTNG